MSTPRSLGRPPGVVTGTLATPRGPLAHLLAEPSGPVRGTAVLVPGFTGSKEDFLALLAPLAARGWRVVTMDLPGQHESPHHSAERYLVAELGHDVRAIIGAIAAEGPLHLLGHSFGGLVARSVLLDGPLPAPGLASLTLLCSGPAAIPGPRAERLHRLLAALDVHDLPTIWAAIRELDAAEGRPAPAPEVLDFLRQRFLGNDPLALRRFAEQLLGEPDQVHALAAVTRRAGVRVLVAHGADDDAWPVEEQKDMAARLGARYEVLPGAGHSPAAERPGDTAALLDSFWADPPDA